MTSSERPDRIAQGDAMRVAPHVGRLTFIDATAAWEMTAMRLQSTLAALCGTGLLALVFGPLATTAQDEPTPERDREQPEQQARPGRGGDRPADRGGPPIDRLREELNELRRMLEQERDARRRVEEQLERSRAEEERDRRSDVAEQERRERMERERMERLERERDRDRDRERERSERRDTPGVVAVAEAKVEASRAALEVTELRAEAARRKLASAERDEGRPLTEAEELVGRLAIAETQAAVAEARARLIEAEFNLGQTLRIAGDVGENTIVKVESEFGVDDALETAEKVIEILRGFEFGERP